MRVELAVQRRHLILPPAVVRYCSYSGLPDCLVPSLLLIPILTCYLTIVAYILSNACGFDRKNFSKRPQQVVNLKTHALYDVACRPIVLLLKVQVHLDLICQRLL